MMGMAGMMGMTEPFWDLLLARVIPRAEQLTGDGDSLLTGLRSDTSRSKGAETVQAPPPPL